MSIACTRRSSCSPTTAPWCCERRSSWASSTRCRRRRRADHRRARRENPGHGRRRGGSDSPVPRVLRRGEVLNRDEPRRRRGSDPALHAGAGVPVAHQEQRRGVAGSILHVYYRRRPPIALVYTHYSYNPIYDCQLNQMVHHMREVNL